MEFKINELLSKDKHNVKETSKMGRPVKTTKRDKRVVCYLTEDELQELKKLADIGVMSQSNYVRQIIVNHVKRKI